MTTGLLTSTNVVLTEFSTMFGRILISGFWLCSKVIASFTTSIVAAIYENTVCILLVSEWDNMEMAIFDHFVRLAAQWSKAQLWREDILVSVHDWF